MQHLFFFFFFYVLFLTNIFHLVKYSEYTAFTSTPIFGCPSYMQKRPPGSSLSNRRFSKFMPCVFIGNLKNGRESGGMPAGMITK